MKKKSARRSENLETFLSEARQRRSMTLNEVASRLGLKSGQSVWDWENGKGSGVPIDMLLRLVKIYGLSSNQAYQHLLRFHQDRVARKLEGKFQRSKAKILGR